MKLRQPPDWKRIARERLDKIHAHERRWDRASIEEIVSRQLSLALRSYISIQRPEAREMIAAAAGAVADGLMNGKG